MRPSGNTKPEFVIAARTRSRASRTALSASPTTVNAGSPRRISASTHTRRASIPSSVKLLTCARLMRADRGRRAASERPPQVVEPHELVAPVDHHADGVAPDPLEERARAHLVQPGTREPADLALLALVQALPRPPPAEPARLDLGEHERVAVDRHQVDLAEARVVIAAEDRPAEPREVVGGELLSEPSERL